MRENDMSDAPLPGSADGRTTFLELEGIRKVFPGVVALDGVDASFRTGEIHSLVGENGAGKSTLMNVMIGLFRPDAGHIRLAGRPITLGRPADARALGIGMVPQELNLVPHLSVMENVLLGTPPLRLAGRAIDWRRLRERAAAALDAVGERVDLDVEAGSLSAARQQSVQIARVLAQDARLLIFDEPTAALSIPEAERLLALVERLRAEGHAIVYVSHRLPEILRISDRITVLRNGCKTAEVSGAEASEAILVRHMIGRGVERCRTETPAPSAATAPILEVRGLTRVGEFEDVSFTLRPGEILGVAGLIGAGRTEMARCLFGDTRPDRGEIRVDGHPVHFRHTSEAIAHGIAYVPEERKRLGIFPVLGVDENLTLPILSRLTRLGGIDRRRRAETTDRWVREFAIKVADPAQPIRNLSGGNQQKVILGRWLATGCRILLLDEPTRGIDVAAKFEIHRILRELATAGIAVLVISSELEEVIELSHRILVMHEGRVRGETEASTATQERLLTMAVDRGATRH
jgi:ribose transport system ATP-binding protein